MKTKISYFGYLILAILGIWYLSGVWLSSGYTLAGHDSGLALNAKDFLLTRLFAWWPQGFGQDNSPHFGSIVLHTFDYFSSVIAKVPYAGNRINVFLCFSLLFSSTFLFAYKLRDKLGKYSPFTFPIFLTINFYIIQSIFILERAKYFVLITSLIMALFIIRVSEGKIKPFLAGIITSLLLLLFNCGSWLGFPIYGGVFVLVLSFLFTELLWAIKDRDFKPLLRVLLYLIITCIGYLILNSYSIFPYLITFTNHDLSSLVNSQIIVQNKAWLESLSQASSFFDFFRLLGIPDWYAGANEINLAHSFANEYLSNKLYLIISVIFPVLTFGSLFLTKEKRQKKYISFFAVTILISMFFMAGSHKPLGAVYEFIFQNLPGFAIFRSPYFKFGSAFFIGVACLMSFTTSNLIEKLETKIKAKNLLIELITVSLVIFSWIYYHKVIFFPEKVFGWQKGYSTRMKVPDYVYSFSDFVKHYDFQEKRIVLLPPLNSTWGNDAYSWGYWSLTNLPSILINNNLLVNEIILNQEENAWLSEIYSAVRSGDQEKLLLLSSRLGVGYFLLRDDILADASWSSVDKPDIYKTKLENFSTVEKVDDFDQWSIYKINANIESKIMSIQSLASVPSGNSYLSRELVNNEKSVFIDNENNSELTNFIDNKLSVFNCQSCGLETKFETKLPIVSILPDSRFYFLKEYKEKKLLDSLQNFQNINDAYLGFVLRRGAETMKMINFGKKEEFITSNLKKMNLYLDLLYKSLTETSISDNDFSGAKRIIDILNLVEINFRTYSNTENFSKQEESLRQEMLGVLWNIYKVKKFYSPIISDFSRWEKEKIYFIDSLKEGNYQFKVDVSSLPINNRGESVYPSEVIYRSEDTIKKINFQLNGNWIKLLVDVVGKEKGKIIIIFDNLPDLFVQKSVSQMAFPEGEKTCLIGKIASFNPSSSYSLSIKTSDYDQILKLYIKKDEKQISATNQFLDAENIESVKPLVSYEPFTYFYSASLNAKDPIIYLCRDTKEIPKIDYFQIHEVVAPSLVLSEEKSITENLLPQITYQKINPTKYKIEIKEAPFPFILFFNERYNPFWKIKNSDGSNLETFHFVIDGYANAWKISKTGSYQIIMEYINQKYFYYGSAITVISFVVFIGYLIWHLRRGKNE